MRARASVVVERVGTRNRCTALVSSPPITLRDTADGLFLVASGAGPVGGDDLALDIVVGASADLTIRSAGASLVLPDRTGTSSSLRVDGRIDGTLRWLPEPTVLVERCDHTTTSRLDIGATGAVLWREEVVLGRHLEPSGSLLQRLHVDVAGRPLLRNELPVGPAWPGADGPAGLDGSRACGSLLGVGVGRPPARPDVAGARAAIVELSPAAWLLTAVAEDAPALRRVLDGALSEVRDDPTPDRDREV